jgi:hypothetical protein
VTQIHRKAIFLDYHEIRPLDTAPTATWKMAWHGGV